MDKNVFKEKCFDKGTIMYHNEHVPRSDLMSMIMRLNRFSNKHKKALIPTIMLDGKLPEYGKVMREMEPGYYNVVHRMFINKYQFVIDTMNMFLDGGQVPDVTEPGLYTFGGNFVKQASNSGHFHMVYLERTRIQPNDFSWAVTMRYNENENKEDFDVTVDVSFNKTSLSYMREHMEPVLKEMFGFVDGLGSFYAHGLSMSLEDLMDGMVAGERVNWYEYPHETLTGLFKEYTTLDPKRGVELVKFFFQKYGDCLDFAYDDEQVIVEVTPRELQLASDLIVQFLDHNLKVSEPRRWFNLMLGSIVKQRKQKEILFTNLDEKATNLELKAKLAPPKDGKTNQSTEVVVI